MKILTLMENTSDPFAEPPFFAEHGLCLYIETQKHTLLVDSGQSDLTWENADRLGIDLSAVDTVVLSHGHYDHSGGLLGFVKRNPNARIYMQKTAVGQYYHGDRYIGIAPELAALSQVTFVENGLVIDDELSLFSNISGRRLWPEGNRALSELVNGRHIQDSFRHEQCLVIQSEGQRVLVSGCAHNGVLNIMDRFKELYGGEPDLMISGFHMMKKTDYNEAELRGIEETARELSKTKTRFFSGHCTGAAFELLKPIMGEKLERLHSGTRVLGD